MEWNGMKKKETKLYRGRGGGEEESKKYTSIQYILYERNEFDYTYIYTYMS
jgi:hypothetical protein